MQARITRKTKSTTQSGRARDGIWELAFDAPSGVRHDPLTGWLGGGDTQAQVQLTFATLEAAIAYCDREEIEYTVNRGSDRTLKIQAYADNFK